MPVAKPPEGYPKLSFQKAMSQPPRQPTAAATTKPTGGQEAVKLEPVVKQERLFPSLCAATKRSHMTDLDEPPPPPKFRRSFAADPLELPEPLAKPSQKHAAAAKDTSNYTEADFPLPPGHPWEQFESMPAAMKKKIERFLPGTQESPRARERPVG